MSDDKYPQTRSPHSGFESVPSPKKKIGADWGGEPNAAHPWNNPTDRTQTPVDDNDWDYDNAKADNS